MGNTSFVAYKVVRHHIYIPKFIFTDGQRGESEACEEQVFHAKVRKTVRFFSLNIKEIPVKELLCKILKLVSRLERDIHGEVSLVESFERKLAIHGYNWNDLD